MSNGLNIPGIRNNPATTTKEELAKRNQPTHEDVGKLADRPDAVAKGPEVNPNITPQSRPTPHREGAEDVATRLDPTQPVSGDSDAASKSPAAVAADPPTPASERKDTLETQDKLKEHNTMVTESTADATQLEAQLAATNVAAGETADDGVVRYSSHPILNYGIGRFKFDNGLLALREKKDIDEFEKTLEQLPISERTRIKKLDLSAAEAQIRAVRDANPGASKAIGSESGDRDPGKKIGSGTLGDSNQ